MADEPANRFDLTGKVALVTGGAQGLGASMAAALADHGANTVVVDIHEDAVQHAAGEMQTAAPSAKVLGWRCDVADQGEVDKTVSRVLDEFDRVDILVNNAGTHCRATPVDFDLDEFDRVFAVNIMGLHYDFPFFAGGSDFVHTVWIPLGDVSISEGPLVTVEGSHRFSDLVQPIQQQGYNAASPNETLQQVAYQQEAASDPLEFVRSRQTRLLTTNFEAGDVMVFSMLMMHGSLDNHSELGRVRLSCDVLYQLSSSSNRCSTITYPSLSYCASWSFVSMVHSCLS